MNIVFFGSDDFASTNLAEIIASKHRVVACVTGPDKAQGRGLKVTVSPIKQMALAGGLPCLQPSTLKDASVVEDLKKFDADVFVVVAYGRLLTQEVLNIPKKFCINVHGSLLPKYRGAAPVNWAILNGDAETGVTIQKMALALDAGDIISQEKMTIDPNETSAHLRHRMALTGAELLVDTLDAIDAGTFKLTVQDESQMSYASKLTKSMGHIDWHQSAQHIYNQIRGLQPWPGAQTYHHDKTIKILQAKMTETSSHFHKPGHVMSVDKEGIMIATGDKGLLITEVHPEAGKAMSAASFAAGYKIIKGGIFSNCIQ